MKTEHAIPTRKRDRRSRQRDGAAVIEFAAVLPVFLLILLGTIETCNMLFLQQSLKIAAYEGARITIIPGTDNSTIDSAVSSLLSARRVKDAIFVVTPSDFQNAKYGEFIKVSVMAPCSSNSSVFLSFYGSKTLTGTVEMMKEF
jgi:Flp pilus assembly protein TadG